MHPFGQWRPIQWVRGIVLSFPGDDIVLTLLAVVVPGPIGFTCWRFHLVAG